MGIMDLFQRRVSQVGEPTETRASGTGYTAQIVTARESWFAGQSGLA